MFCIRNTSEREVLLIYIKGIMYDILMGQVSFNKNMKKKPGEVEV